MERANQISKRWLMRAALCLLMPLHAFAVTISNTANLTYIDPSTNPGSVNSNTVVATTLPNPTPATVEFFSYSPVASSEIHQADGGQCFQGGVFQPIVGLTTHMGAPIDTTNPINLEAADAYHAGEA